MAHLSDGIPTQSKPKSSKNLIVSSLLQEVSPGSSLGVPRTKPTCSAQSPKHEVVPEPASRFRLAALHTGLACPALGTREMVIG